MRSKASFARLAAAASLALVCAGCSSTGLLNALEPKGGVEVRRDLVYAPGARHSLDVYRPRRADGRAPVVVFIYGGGWDSGTKAMYGFVGDALARHGYVAVIPDYRLYPQVVWPAFLQDNALAVRWAHDHAGQFGGDPSRLVLVGHSAGAYDAVMLAVDGRWLREAGLDPRRDVRAAVGLAGPYDFLPLDSDKLKTIFGPPAQRPDTQPINHVDGRAPPLLLAHDVGDTVVRPLNTRHMAAKVRAAGGVVEERYYTGLSHPLLIGAIAAPLRFLAPVLKDVTTFIDAHAGGPPAR